MTFRATSQEAAKAYTLIKTQAAATRAYLIAQRAAMQQATCDSNIVLVTIQHFGSVVAKLAAWAATPGLAQYAKDQENDQAYDVVAEFQTMNAALVNARDTLIGMFPKDGNGFLLYQTLNANGQVVSRTFTAAQLAAAVPLLNSAIATIS